MDMRPTNAYIYIYLVSTTSFGFGLWAFIVGFKASLRQLKDFYYLPKIVTFQLCLVFLRLQAIIVNSILVPTGAIPCLPPISPKVFANTLLNSLLLGQLVILSVIARNYYKLPIPEVVSMEDDIEKAPEDELEKKQTNGHLYSTEDPAEPIEKVAISPVNKSDDEPLLNGDTVSSPSL
ncbi:hypothetical protein SK128_026072 [Halocaridina rubra]|uniref:Uncharacterized protein n=1 Tax=Halocaridina rubra TaxID=373956 RepID=A0AAN8XEP4_HALRR